jgi:hypothetical protein
MKLKTESQTEEQLTTLFSKAAKIIEAVPPSAMAKAFEMAVSRLEGEAFVVSKKPSLKKNNTSQKITKDVKKKTSGLNGNILKLIDDGYFNSDKSPQDLCEMFKKKALTYTRQAISVALMRLVRKNILSRNGEGSSKNPWVYIKT